MSLKPLGMSPAPAAGASPDPKAALAAAATGRTPSANVATKKKFQIEAKTLDQELGDAMLHRLLGFGHSGVGKTTAIIAFLEMGMKVFVLSTDVGGDGLNTVRNALAARPELLANLMYIHIDDYEPLDAFLEDPVTLGGPVYAAFEPDVQVWDGYTGFQMHHVEEYVDGDSSISELQFDIPTWGKIRRASLRELARFMKLRTPSGRKVHKYVTCLESKPKENDLTGERRKAPLIQGTAGSIVEAAFDLIIEMRLNEKKEFEYRCIGTSGIAAKSRGYRLNAVEPGDMKKLWAKLTGASNA